ncbi:LysR substrate-binding domain-containing protein [Rugamonas sp. CCM 8940]|uniref:LysR substrate-binding domain-containing protein n=1 Tax=Rugamonas sp. CCM 8940 TaxID=2765359 RepID=UPI0018F3363A|nr:LysR substrate-binding domain-containing protein [Rugamonas sp. CCM 8940]MBJ7309001.1 LysR family transcriptional regulator [Rugamonas sp. CCM 8940]
MSNRLLDLPPLDLLRTFVAVGRRMSITLASQELCLTQSALSRQVQALESFLGYRLFVRSHRRIEFTSAGQRLFRSADSALEQLGDVVAALHPGTAGGAVTISASIGVTALWLLPRLGAFQRAAPGIDVRVAANNRFVDLERENIDLAVRYCKRADAPEHALFLFDEELVPVAHPALGVSRIEDPEQLRQQVLLDFDDVSRPWLQWHDWWRKAGKGKLQARGVLHFNQYDQVVQAALAGQGVALGRLALVRPLLDEGKLVLASARAPASLAYGYWLIARHAAPNANANANASIVRDWIVAEAAGMQSASGQGPLS